MLVRSVTWSKKVRGRSAWKKCRGVVHPLSTGTAIGGEANGCTVMGEYDPHPLFSSSSTTPSYFSLSSSPRVLINAPSSTSSSSSLSSFASSSPSESVSVSLPDSGWMDMRIARSRSAASSACRRSSSCSCEKKCGLLRTRGARGGGGVHMRECERSAHARHARGEDTP